MQRRLQGLLTVSDSPHNRELLATWERQQSRRLTTRQILFTGTSSTAHGRALSPRLDGTTSSNTTTSTSSPHFCDLPIDPGIEFTVSSDAEPSNVDPAALDLHITSRIISGSSNSTHITSNHAFTTCMSTLDIRFQFPKVYEAKKNRCATTPSLFNHILKNEKQLVAPSGQHGDDLRSALKAFIDSVSAEYQTPARTNSELILCALAHMNSADSKCFVAQFHKGISCPTSDFETFEDDCAQGKISPIQINYSLPVESLIGFSYFASSDFSSVFLIRLTTALTDYMAYVTNSDLQLQYTLCCTAWQAIRLQNGMKPDQFAIKEEQGFALMTAAATAAQRSVPNNLDRGLTLLKHLPTHLKSLISKLDQKKSIPENLMTRDWVMAQVKRIELEATLKFTWNDTSTTTCNNFVAGKCTRGNNCPYSHVGVTPTHAPTVANTAMITAPAAAADAIEVNCVSTLAPNCEQTFTTSPAYWASLKTPDGQSFSVPKSCKPCRDFKKQMAAVSGVSASMITVTNTDIDDDQHDQHENDGADDDYYTNMTDYSMTMMTIVKRSQLTAFQHLFSKPLRQCMGGA